MLKDRKLEDERDEKCFRENRKTGEMTWRAHRDSSCLETGDDFSSFNLPAGIQLVLILEE